MNWIHSDNENRSSSEAKSEVQVTPGKMKVSKPNLQKMYFKCQILSQYLPNTSPDTVPDTAVSMDSV